MFAAYLLVKRKLSVGMEAVVHLIPALIYP